ncbi:MAG: cupin domain-containing protein [Solirubrobacterales bacterium]
MADITVKRLEDFDTAFGGGMLRVRAGLGITAFGLQVLELPPGYEGYPEHSHSHDEQEEVYTLLSGKITLRAGGEDHELEPGTFARVGPGEKRKLITGEKGARILAIGGTPGKVYEPPEFTEEGAGEMPKAKSADGAAAD